MRVVTRLVDEEVLGEGPHVDVAAGFRDWESELLLWDAVFEGGVATGDAGERGCWRVQELGLFLAIADFVGEGEMNA